MISVKPNPNFSNWFQVISFGKLIDEYSRRSKALKVASKMALQHQHKYIVVDGVPREVEAK